MPRLWLILVLGSALVSTPALAGAGVVEINATCASVGCFSGDAPLLPVTIDGSAGRSYILTSDLAVGSANLSGIVVSAADVSIDLGGFAIRGLNSCGGAAGGCTYSGSGFGIEGTADRLQVSNGSVVGSGGVGIDAGAASGSVIRNVRAAHNRYQGIVAGTGALVEDCTAMRNGDVGIYVGVAARVNGSSAFDNGLHGIQGASGASVANSASYSNGLDGIVVDAGNVMDCSVRDNARYGINFLVGALGRGGLVTRCVVNGNGNSGIRLASTTLAAENSVSDNRSHGIEFVFGASAYRANLITDNDGAPAIGSPIDLGDNGCTDSSNAIVACP